MNKYRKIPEYTLDLHGKTCYETAVLLDSLLSDMDYRHIRIITGKGSFREKKGVLSEFVKFFLRGKGICFERSKLEDGGEGALEVFIVDD